MQGVFVFKRYAYYMPKKFPKLFRKILIFLGKIREVANSFGNNFLVNLLI